jgi:methyltransferase (TIGR00027 family)
MKTGAPSRTAEYMALFRALESARPERERLFEDRAAASFLRPSLRAVALAARFGPARSPILALIDRRWPGPRLSGVVRTRVIDDFVLDAMRAGCTQLVLLGAGYDTRASRLPAVAGSTVFEIDHPTTQARKHAALGHPSEHVRYVPLDFESDALQPALRDAGLDRDQRACVLWEGVFSYLTPEAIDATLAALVQACAPHSQILLTYIDQRYLDTTNPQAGAWSTAVNDVGEPFQTGIDPADAQTFFAARNLTLQNDESTTHAAHRLGIPNAHTIPDMYRLATLQTTPASPQP